MPLDSSSNHLLDLLDVEARAALSPVAVQLRNREVLHESGAPVLYAFFPVGAVISLVSTMENGASSEVAVVGREGMVGLAGVLGTVEGATAAVVQIGGSALRVSTARLRQQRVRTPSVRAVVDLYTEARLMQLAQTAACNRLHSVEGRMARWLLAVSDRIDAEYFTLPQEFMAQMLGVQRPTVSLTLQGLRRRGLVVYRGRSMKIADRVGLERAACECYRVLRREFERLLRRPMEGLVTLPQVVQHSGGRDSQSAAALETMARDLGAPADDHHPRAGSAR